VLTKLVWENMKTRCATSRQRLLSRLTTVERAWRPLVSDRLISSLLSSAAVDETEFRRSQPGCFGFSLQGNTTACAMCDAARD
jgi:hypothetical protein